MQGAKLSCGKLHADVFPSELLFGVAQKAFNIERQLLRIEEELGSTAKFGGRKAFRR